MYSKYSQWNIGVPTVNIPKPRRLKVVVVNRINNYCPSYVTKAPHVASCQKRPRTVQNQNNKQVIANDLKSKSSCLLVLCDDVICFRAAKKYHSSLHWDCIPFFVECNQSEKPVQRRLQNVENNERSHKREQEWRNRWTRIGDDVIRFAPAAGRPNWCRKIVLRWTVPWNLTEVCIRTAFNERNKFILWNTAISNSQKKK